MVDARFRRTKLNRNGPELSDAMLVPPENVERRRPALEREDRCDITDEARLDHPPREVSSELFRLPTCVELPINNRGAQSDTSQLDNSGEFTK